MTQFDFSQIHEHHDMIPAGQVIFNEGDPGDAMYILLEGEVKNLFSRSSA
ncbi:MAG: cyclic nucleotide-binding domain-containing protein [Chloroflexota bacterium]